MDQKKLKICVLGGDRLCILGVGDSGLVPPQINAFCQLLVADSYQ